jgi:carbamoyl-phosphate synthase large subunit
MKATGEVMAIAVTIEEALLKAIRSLEENVDSLEMPILKKLSDKEILKKLENKDSDRLWTIAEALRRGIKIEEISKITTIDKFFLSNIYNIVNMEKRLKEEQLSDDLLLEAKEMGFLDLVISRLTNIPEKEIKERRKKKNIIANYKMVDTCAAEFAANTPFYYSSYDKDNVVYTNTKKKKIIVLGSGPIRIGQGIEFDYCSVHSVWALKKQGYETIIINNNPETVSTDFDIADKLYFEPLTREDVENIVDLEKPEGAIVQFGGQTAIKLTKALHEMGVKILRNI